MPVWYLEEPDVPLRALLVSAAALLIPAALVAFGGAAVQEYSLLVWIPALIPPFLASYYRGWRGAATALAAGMAALALGQAGAAMVNGSPPAAAALVGPVLSYVGVSFGAGGLAERLHGERARAELLALTDDLTSLPNRRWAKRQLERALDKPGGAAIVLFDIDDFKVYNDTHGHPAGDRALLDFAAVLRRATPDTVFVSRYGGDEFLAVIPGGTLSLGQAYASAVRAALDNEPGNAPAAFSAGVAATYQGRSYADLLVAADEALYRCKNRGGNCIEVEQSVAA